MANKDLSIVLLSGGVDSALCLDMARQESQTCVCLAFDYGQRHRIELKSAKAIADHYQTPLYTMQISCLQALKTPLVQGQTPIFSSEELAKRQGIAATYVPARNTLFLAHALLLAEELQAQMIWFGANLDDCRPYPDCRPAFFDAFNELARHATAQAQLQTPVRIITPLLKMTKKEIIAEVQRRSVPLEKTWSCYSPTQEDAPCKECLACSLRYALID